MNNKGNKICAPIPYNQNVMTTDASKATVIFDPCMGGCDKCTMTACADLKKLEEHTYGKQNHT